jgi:CHASE3 domain sensor protein
VLYSIEEDNMVIKKLTEKKYLERELDVCDSVVDVLRERENFYQVIVDDQKEQLEIMRDLKDMQKAQTDELKAVLEENSKRERRKGRWMTALLVLGCVFTLGLLAVVILK